MYPELLSKTTSCLMLRWAHIIQACCSYVLMSFNSQFHNSPWKKKNDGRGNLELNDLQSDKTKTTIEISSVQHLPLTHISLMSECTISGTWDFSWYMAWHFTTSNYMMKKSLPFQSFPILSDCCKESLNLVQVRLSYLERCNKIGDIYFSCTCPLQVIFISRVPILR